MNKANLSHVKQCNAIWLLRFTGYGLLGMALVLSGCSDTSLQSKVLNPIEQQPLVASPPVIVPKQPPVIHEQQPIESLLVQLKDNDSCLNQLSNLRFALEHDLFNQVDLYTAENLIKFFDKKYYDINYFDGNLGVFSKNGYFTFKKNQHKFPKKPCFDVISISTEVGSKWEVKDTKNRFSKAVIPTRMAFSASNFLSVSNFDRLNNLKFEELLASFQPMTLVSVRNCGDAMMQHWGKLISAHSVLQRKTSLRQTLKNIEKDMPEHAFGECELQYKLNTKNYLVDIIIITYRDGNIADLRINSTKQK